MKIFLSIILILFFQKDQDIVSYKADCISMNNDGIVKLLIWDIEDGKKYKLEQAQKDAVAYVLYEGFKGGKCGYISPLLKSYESKHEFENTNAYFFKKSGHCLDYVVSSELSDKRSSKINNDSWLVYEVEVNKKVLDEYLVNQKIKNSLDIYTE